MVAGGYSDIEESDLDTVEILELAVFSSEDPQWTLLSHRLHSPLFKPGLVTLGGFPYLLGGDRAFSTQSGIYKFNADQPSQHWTKVSDLITPRYLFSTSLVQFEEIQGCCTTQTSQLKTNNGDLDHDHDHARHLPNK